MIPWRYTFASDLTPDQVLAKLEYVTDQKKLSVCKSVDDLGPSMDGRSSRIRFRGAIDREHRKFYVHGNLTGNDKSQTAFTGRIGPNGTGSIVTTWISATRAGLIMLAIMGPVAIVVSLLLTRMVLWDARRAPLWFLVFPFLFLVVVPMIDIWINIKARKILREVVNGTKLTQWPDPWPIRTSGGKVEEISPMANVELLPKDATLPQRFREFASTIAESPASPPMTLDIDPHGTTLSLFFPVQGPNGFDVLIEVDRDGASIQVGTWIQIPVHGNDRLKIVRDTFGIIRDLVSPRCRLTECYIGEQLSFARLESGRPGHWTSTGFEHIQRVTGEFGERTVVYYQNEQLPERHGRHYL
jgi:hypothetical protein